MEPNWMAFREAKKIAILRNKEKLFLIQSNREENSEVGTDNGIRNKEITILIKKKEETKCVLLKSKKKTYQVISVQGI